MACPPLQQNLFGQFLLGRFFMLLLGRIRDQPLEERDALDQFGQALDHEQEESDRHQQPRRPDEQAAGVRRDLMPLVSAGRTRARTAT